MAVNEFQSGKYDSPSQVEGLTEGELVLTQLGFVDSTGKAYGFEWAGYSILFSLLVCVVSVIGATICLSRVRFATGKSLANDAIEEKEDKNNGLDTSNTDLPFQRVNLTFSEIHYFVTSSITKEKLELLKGVDGVVEAGKMTALVRLLKVIAASMMVCFAFSFPALKLSISFLFRWGQVAQERPPSWTAFRCERPVVKSPETSVSMATHRKS